MAKKSISTQQNVIDVDLSITSKKRFRINGDDTKILELNTSDFGIIHRLNESMKKLEELENSATSIDDADLDGISNKLSKIDSEMRDIVNYIFDADVCSVVASDGSMFDFFNGAPRYDHVLSALIGLYEDNLQREVNIQKQRMKSHTDKYKKG